MTPALLEVDPEGGTPSTVPENRLYSLLVSKDDRPVAQLTFAEVLANAIETHYEHDSAFAAAAGISNSAVSRYKGGQVPRPDTIQKMAPFMHMSVPRLMAIAYPRSTEPDADFGAAVHPLAATLNQLLDPNTPMPEDERNNLKQVVRSVLAPYDRFLRGRKAV